MPFSLMTYVKRIKGKLVHVTFVWLPNLLVNRKLIFEKNLKQQSALFVKNGLSRTKALPILEDACKQLFGCGYSEKKGMFSEHLVIFAAIAASGKPVKSILEIGTHDGKMAVLLSKLFPLASVMTIDLPHNDPLFIETYSRTKNHLDFIKERNELISRFPKITLIEANSLSLTNNEETFDLIWIDGAHGYPVVTIDIVNSFRLIGKDGLIFIDDIYTNAAVSDSMYKSVAAY